MRPPRLERANNSRTDPIPATSTSAYQKPLGDNLITESIPLVNPFWEYSRLKIAAEERLLAAYRDEGLPATIVRPALTYGETSIPLALTSRSSSPATASPSGRSRTTATSPKA